MSGQNSENRKKEEQTKVVDEEFDDDVDPGDATSSDDDSSEIEGDDAMDDDEDTKPAGGLKNAILGSEKYVRVANGLDEEIWVAERSERQISSGGAGFNLNVAEILGVGGQQPQYENRTTPDATARMVPPHSVQKIVSVNDFNDIVTLAVFSRSCPVPQDIRVEQTRAIILAGPKLAARNALKKYVPMGNDGRRVKRRRKNYEGDYDGLMRKAELEMLWIPEDDPDQMSLNPHTINNLTNSSCPICKRVFTDRPINPPHAIESNADGGPAGIENNAPLAIENNADGGPAAIENNAAGGSQMALEID